MNRGYWHDFSPYLRSSGLLAFAYLEKQPKKNANEDCETSCDELKGWAFTSDGNVKAETGEKRVGKLNFLKRVRMQFVFTTKPVKGMHFKCRMKIIFKVFFSAHRTHQSYLTAQGSLFLQMNRMNSWSEMPKVSSHQWQKKQQLISWKNPMLTWQAKFIRVDYLPKF